MEQGMKTYAVRPVPRAHLRDLNDQYHFHFLTNHKSHDNECVTYGKQTIVHKLKHKPTKKYKNY